VGRKTRQWEWRCEINGKARRLPGGGGVERGKKERERRRREEERREREKKKEELLTSTWALSNPIQSNPCDLSCHLPVHCMETPFKLHQIETLLFVHLNRSGLAVPDAVLAFLLWLDLLIDMIFVLMAHKSYIYTAC
jgi:hypothetical protein